MIRYMLKGTISGIAILHGESREITRTVPLKCSKYHAEAWLSE